MPTTRRILVECTATVRVDGKDVKLLCVNDRDDWKHSFEWSFGYWPSDDVLVSIDLDKAW